MNQVKGFTLIELIIVIVILGILAVTAAPKFLDVTGDARASVIESISGSWKQSVDVVYAKAVLEGKDKTLLTVIENEQGQLIPVYFGYVIIAANGETLNKILDSTIDYTDPEPEGFSLVATTTSVTEIRDIEAADPEHCKVIYTDPKVDASGGTASLDSPPIVETDVTGC